MPAELAADRKRRKVPEECAAGKTAQQADEVVSYPGGNAWPRLSSQGTGRYLLPYETDTADNGIFQGGQGGSTRLPDRLLNIDKPGKYREEKGGKKEMRKTMRKMLAGLLAAAVVAACAVPVYAADGSPGPNTPSQTVTSKNEQAETVNGMTPTVDTSKKGTATVKGVESTKKDVTLPKTSTVNGVTYTNTKLGKNAFKESPKAKTVTVPATFTEIAAQAFAGSNVTSVTVKGDSKQATTLGKNALKGSKVKTLNLGTKKGKIQIGNGAVNGANSKLKMTFNATKSNKVVVGKKAFKNVNTKKMTIETTNMSKKEFKKFKKAMKAAGFEGKITRKKA